jgi:hypothetical protein
MVATRAQKRSAADIRNPLHQSGILQRVLDYVGPGHWCFVAEVSSLWRDLTNKVTNMFVDDQVVGSTCRVNCYPTTTMFSAVFASPSRLRYAQARELHCTTSRYQHAAGMYADVATLEAAHALGMPYTYSTIVGAARLNTLDVVQFLHAQGCPWGYKVYSAAARRGHTALCAHLHAEQCPLTLTNCEEAALKALDSTMNWLQERPWDAFAVSDAVHVSAAASGSIAMMLLVQQHGIMFATDMLSEMLQAAGGCEQLAGAKWLRQQGAEWPAELCWGYELWFGDTLRWARAEGCRSPVE